MSWQAYCFLTKNYTRVTSPGDVRRSATSALHFYQNRQLDLYASKDAHRLSLRQLVFFGRQMNEERLIKSANYVRMELPVRIAHRIRDLQALPYVIVTQPEIAKVYELYWSAFDNRFRRFPEINNLSDNWKFCDLLETLLDEHAPVIPNLSLGLSLCSPHIPPDSLDAFMRRMLISRISRRVLAEHHLALSKSLGRDSVNSKDPHVGIIFTSLSVKRSVDKCAHLLRSRSHGIEDDNGEIIPSKGWPKVVVEGQLNARFAYIREHLEYILFELLKNAMRATGLKHRHDSTLPPIFATIVAGKDDVGIRITDQGGGLYSNGIQSPSDLFSFSHIRNATRMDDNRIGALRSASSKGVKATVAEQVGGWQAMEKGDRNAKDPERGAGIAPHQRMGLGLPMSNIFATYFGGSLQLVSLDGLGTDAYLRLPRLVGGWKTLTRGVIDLLKKGTNLEGIEV
ncbi:alpha-ketoacid dehydrogenase kinase [Pisolithus croceorrhizus]|nr:alpha-ketoacid dehydrogenase kinase [Pisolithus croceorrhizus]